MRRLLLCLTAVALLLAGCGARKNPGSAVVVLIDVSGSTTNVQERYMAEFERVLDGLQGGDHLFVQPVRANSLVAPVAIDLAFPAYNALDLNPTAANEHTHAQEMKKRRQEALDRVAKLVQAERPAQQGSAIIDGLSQAGSLLAAYPPERRVVILLSDMVEQSEVADFTALTEHRVDEMVAALKARSRLPDLQGARVFVAGITDGENGKLSASQILTLKHFWTRYFTTAGATLKWYGPSLMGFGKEESG